MKKIIISLFTVATILLLTQCNNTPENICNNAGSRGTIISSLMSNDAYMNEVMDSMRVKHSDAMVSTVFNMANSNKQMQENMMDKMTGMCKADSSMFKMMIDKTMDMCDADQSKSSMMIGSMQSHPKIMNSMHQMGKMKMGGKMDMHQR